tara:strand:+ start:288 stop:1139 length:852 start_codon:yes stop_codon:yes gene_type:complete
LTKDETHYLFYVEEGIGSMALIAADSAHFIHPLVLFYWFQAFDQTPIYFLTLPIFLLSCRYFLKSTKLNNELFLISLLPTAYYAGTYLREPFLFSAMFFLLGFLIRQHIMSALLLSTIMTGYRFYWAIISYFSLLLFGSRKTAVFLALIYIMLSVSILSNFAQYSISAVEKISLDIVDLLRVFIIPLPAFQFEGDVNLYENAVLYTMTFPLRVFTLCLFTITCTKVIFTPLRLGKDQKLILIMGILILAGAFLTSLVGPRQVILGQSLLVLSLTGQYKMIWRR